MGSRANYTWIKDGEAHFSTSRFGALTIPNDFFWGPERTFTWLESLDEVDHEEDLYGFPWVEGGALLNADTQRLYLYATAWETNLHRVEHFRNDWLKVRSPYLLRMFRMAWEGWHVHFVESDVYVSPWIQGACSELRNPLNYARAFDPEIDEGVDDWLPDADITTHQERFSEFAQLLLSYRSDTLGNLVQRLKEQGHEVLAVAHDDVTNPHTDDRESFLRNILMRLFYALREVNEL